MPTFALGQKMATKTPQYGGTFTTIGHTITSWDPGIDANPHTSYVFEQLGFGDWSKPRDECPMTIDYMGIDCGTPQVAERYEIEDPETMVFFNSITLDNASFLSAKENQFFSSPLIGWVSISGI